MSTPRPSTQLTDAPSEPRQPSDALNVRHILAERPLVVASAQGNAAEVHALLNLCRTLYDNGQDLLFMANEAFRADVIRVGLPFVSLGPAREYEKARDELEARMKAPGRTRWCELEYYAPARQRAFSRVQALKTSPLNLVVLALDDSDGAAVAAERFNIPWIEVRAGKEPCTLGLPNTRFRRRHARPANATLNNWREILGLAPARELGASAPYPPLLSLRLLEVREAANRIEQALQQASPGLGLDDTEEEELPPSSHHRTIQQAVTSPPFFSVLVELNEPAGALEPFLTSLCEQDFKDFEILVWGNVVGDATRRILDRHSPTPVHYVLSDTCEREAGLRSAVQLAQGRWLLTPKANEEWMPNFLSQHQARLCQAAPKVIGALPTSTKLERDSQGRAQRIHWQRYANRVSEAERTLPGLTVRRDAILSSPRLADTLARSSVSAILQELRRDGQCLLQSSTPEMLVHTEPPQASRRKGI